MDIWTILGLEGKTEDKEVIQEAYMERLMHVNPEDDPEGFQKLRAAFEEAMKIADGKGAEEPEEQFDDTEEGHFMKDLDAVFKDFQKRIDPENWRELMNRDVVVRLDMKETIREKVLSYLMRHYLIPHNVWQVIVETFSIDEKIDELSEQFPRDFLEYAVNNAHYDDALDYTRFEEAGDYPYDKYIDLALHLHRTMNTPDCGDLEPQFEELFSMGLTHPFGLIEHVRYLVLKKDFDRAKFEAEPIIEEYEDMSIARIMMAEIHSRSEDYATAREWYEKTLEIAPDFYSAKLGLAECIMHEGDYADAKKRFKDLLGINRFDTYVHAMLTQCNEKLIEEMRAKFEENPADTANDIELIWSLYQNYLFDDAIQVLEEMPVPEDAMIMDYHYLYGRVLLQKDEYQKAADQFLAWIKDYEIHKDDDAPKEVMDRNHDRRALSYYFVAECYLELDEKVGNPLALEQALEYNETAIKNTALIERDDDSGMCFTQRSMILNRMKQFEEAVDYAEKAVSVEQNNYDAYLQMGYALQCMHQYKDAIRAYSDAIYYCPYYVKPYIDLMSLYEEVDAYEAMEDVLNDFLKREVPSTWIKVYQSKILRRKKDLNGALAIITQAATDMEDEEKNDVQQKDQVYHEKALVHYYRDEYDDALKALEKARELKPESPRYFFFTGNVYFEKQEYENAIRFFEIARDMDKENVNPLFRLAACVREMRQYDKAKEYLEEVRKIAPDHYMLHGNLGEVLEDAGDFEGALAEYSLQMEADPTSYYAISRGLMNFRLGFEQEAAEDFEQACELDKGNGYSYYNRARVYMASNHLEEAIDLLKKAILVSEGHVPKIFYRYLARCYSRLHDMDNLEKTVYEAKRLGLIDDDTVADTLLEAYTTAGYPERAEKLLKNSPDIYYNTCVKVILKKQNLMLLEMSLARDYKSNGGAYRAYARVLMLRGKYKQAAAIWEEYHKEFRSSNTLPLAYCYKKMGAEAKLDEVLRVLEEKEKQNLSDYQSRKHGFFQLAMCAYLRGQYTKTREYLQEMENSAICDFCRESACYEVDLVKALLAQADNDKNTAMVYFAKAYENCKNDFAVFAGLGGKL
ncbi:MAG: tetratricopeptide repeat protein [Lachnospiraceae bacterium]|nr:tetratricopeptide repeat protein [Lachnospiraceae bacterium]